MEVTPMDNSDPNIDKWSDEELMNQLEKHYGDLERDVEREVLRRLMEKVNTLVPAER